MDVLAEKSDLFATLTMKLAGLTVDKVGRKKSAFNAWSRANPEVKVEAAAKIAAANLPGKQRGAARQSRVQEIFNRLPKSERDGWEKESVQIYKQAEKDHAAKLKEPPLESPEDRQLYVITLSIFGHSCCSLRPSVPSNVYLPLSSRFLMPSQSIQDGDAPSLLEDLSLRIMES